MTAIQAAARTVTQTVVSAQAQTVTPSFPVAALSETAFKLYYYLHINWTVEAARVAATRDPREADRGLAELRAHGLLHPQRWAEGPVHAIIIRQVDLHSQGDAVGVGGSTVVVDEEDGE